jgi:prolyl oligopeptidase
MRVKSNLSVRLLAAATVLLVVSAVAAQQPDYPPTHRDNVVETIHGVQVHDPYRWLENADDPGLAAWVEQQNALTRDHLDRFAGERQQLRRELEGLYEASVMSSPRRFGERYFYRKRDPGQNQSVLYVREGNLNAPARVLIDANKLSEDGTVSLDWWHPSPDGRLVVYGTSAGGNEDTTLYLRDVTTGKDTGLVIPHARHSSVAWDPDGKGFHYTRHPAPGSVPPGDEMYYRRLYYHKLGTDWREDPLVVGEDQPKTASIDCDNSSDYSHQLLYITTDWARNDLYIREPGADEFTPVVVGLDAQFFGDVAGAKLFVRTNHRAPSYRIFEADVSNPTRQSWKDVVPERTGVIDEFRIVGGRLVVSLLEDVHSRLFVYELDGTLDREIELPALGTVRDLAGRPEHAQLFFRFSSFAYPAVTYQCDLDSGAMHELDRMEIALSPDEFVTKQVWFRSKDGTRVPMFVIHQRGLKLDGSNPAVLNAYGGFNISIRPEFRPGIIPWLERGGVFAIANLRGGGEFGRPWHLAGRKQKKQNVFDDMIAAAEKLISDGYTRPERLGTTGGSNGGLLMGAMITQRPDLFKAVVCGVPLLDMVRYHHSTIARLWIPEYGSAENPDEFRYLYAYSPYHHVQEGSPYPAVLFRTGEFDTRVDPMHARKMTALLQDSTGSDAPILLWVERKTGHGGGRPVSKRVAAELDQWTFFGWQLGMFASVH